MRQATTIHLGALSPGPSCGLPGTIRRATDVPAWPCSGWGLPAVSVTGDAGGLLHHRFTLACSSWSSTPTPSAVCSLRHFPSGHPAWKLSSTLPCGVRTFLDALGASRPSDGLSPILPLDLVAGTTRHGHVRFWRPASQPVNPEMTTETMASQTTVRVSPGLPPSRAITMIMSARSSPVTIP